MWQDNGHYYEAIGGSFTWEAAYADAQTRIFNGVQGHLVTLTSSGENDFVWTNFPFTHYFIGGYQPPGSVEPDGGWLWITGEPWVWVNWASGEPNNNGDEKYIQFNYTGGGFWNDVGVWNSGYIVEYDMTVPDIKANDSDGPLSIAAIDILSLTVSLSAGANAGQNADWWVLGDTSFGYYYYDLSLNWQRGLNVTHQGPLFDLNPNGVLNRKIPPGFYTFYFGVDMNMNGSLDANWIYDSVEVTVTP